MTLLEVPGALDPGAWVFDAADLESVGVEFAPEQIALFEAAQHQAVGALHVGFPTDPCYRQFGAPLETMDTFGDRHMVVCPEVVTLTPRLLEPVLQATPNISRFPWLPGQTCEPTQSRYWGPDTQLHAPQGYRLWSLWPISCEEREDLLDAIRAWKVKHYMPLDLWYQVEHGNTTACEVLTELEGLDFDSHSHKEHLDSNFEPVSIDCADGEYWMEEFRQAHIRLDDDGLAIPLPLPPIRLDDPFLHERWEQLRMRSEINAHRAMSLLGPDDRFEVLRTERYYSPWLWLS